MPPKKSKAKSTAKDHSTLWLIVILIIGFLLRAYNNTAVSLWHDEAFSALYVRDYSWSEMMYRIGLDVHPPLYYWILKLWTYVFGTSLISLRGLSVIFGILTIWVAFIFIKKIFSNSAKKQKLALLAAFFIAINPFQIQYSLEARMYTLGTFFVLLSSYWILRALETKKWRDWMIYGVLVAACVYTHYYLIFSVIAQGLYLLFWLIKNKQFNKNLFHNETIKISIAFIFSVLLFLPWLKQFLIQRTRVESQYWIPDLDRWSIPSTIWKMIFGGQGINHFVLVIGSIVAIFFLIIFIKRIQLQEKWLIFLGLIIPFLTSIALSWQTAIYLDRYFVFASLFLTMIVVIVLNEIPNPSMKSVLTSLFVIAIIFTFFKNWYDLDVNNLFFNRSINRKPGIAAVSKIVNDQALPTDHIYVGSSFIYFTYRYYNETGIKPLLISDRGLESIPHFSGTALLASDDLVLIDTIFNHPMVKKNENVWLLWTTGFGGSKPNVPGNWNKTAEYSYADTPGFKGDIYATQYHVR